MLELFDKLVTHELEKKIGRKPRNWNARHSC
jgi:hypothetical protein